MQKQLLFLSSKIVELVGFIRKLIIKPSMKGSGSDSRRMMLHYFKVDTYSDTSLLHRIIMIRKLAYKSNGFDSPQVMNPRGLLGRGFDTPQNGSFYPV